MYARKNKSCGNYNIIDYVGINKSINNVINSNIDFNIYTSPKGLKELRIEISNILKFDVNYNNIVITNGSQQSINLIARCLVKDNDVIFMEQPTYFGAIDIFKKRNIKLIGITLNEDGLNLKELESKIKKYSPRLIYTIPTFNNPTGYSWSDKNRKEFLNIINKYNILVIEDDPYSLINLTNKKYKSLYELNNGKNIIYLGTFSKVISPSIKVGYIISNESILNKILDYKKSYDLCTNTFIQYVVLDYLKSNNLYEKMQKKIKKYKKLLKNSIKNVKNNYKIDYFTKSKGGLFYLVKFKDNIENDEFENGSIYYINKKVNNISRINICSELCK